MKRVGLVLFDDVDLLDVGGPYEVLLTANRLRQRRGEAPVFDVVTVGLGAKPVTAYGGMRVIPAASFDDVEDVDIVVLPGAIAIDEVLGRSDLQNAIRELLERSPVAVSVCVGAFFLGDAGMLGGRSWTTHWEDIPALAERIGSGLGERARWVDTGDVITSGGLSSGIAMALHLVEREAGRDLALATANQIDYDWDPYDGVVSPAVPGR